MAGDRRHEYTEFEPAGVFRLAKTKSSHCLGILMRLASIRYREVNTAILTFYTYVRGSKCNETHRLDFIRPITGNQDSFSSPAAFFARFDARRHRSLRCKCRRIIPSRACNVNRCKNDASSDRSLHPLERVESCATFVSLSNHLHVPFEVRNLVKIA